MDSRPEFPGGQYRVSTEDNLALCAAVGAVPDAEGKAHPIFYYIATQVAMGLTVAELCRLADFDVADGPMLAQSAARFESDILVDQGYTVTGRILSIVRKPSRSFGAIDLLTYELGLTNDHGERTALCTNQWVLPRRGEAA